MLNIFRRKTRFLVEYDRIAREIAAGKLLTPRGDRFSEATIQNYRRSKFSFFQYEKERGPIYLDDMTLSWALQFIAFLMEKGYAKNTIAITMSRVKSIIRRLHDDGRCAYDGKGIPTANELTTAIYTSIEEIRQLLECDLSDTPGLERIRDIYIINCFVGLRVSDLQVFLSEKNRYIREIGGRLFIDLRTKKTFEPVVIPIARVVKQLLDKYDFNQGRPFSLSYYNRDLKEVCRRAGITQDIVFTRTEGGHRIDTVRQKCELMSSHTARRTFATNAFLAGLQEKNIMLITGHKTTQAFHRYIRCTSLDAAIKIANHDFFNIEMPVTISLPHVDLPSLDG